MNEQEFSRALHGAMATIEAPPPMNGTEVLDAAKRAQRRRRATVAGVACAAVVVLIAVGAVVGSNLPDSGTGPIGVAPDTADTPDPRQETGGKLFDLLIASVPDGMQVPTDQRTHQARFVDRVGDNEVWMYTARTNAGRDGGWGTLLADVYTAGNTLEGEGCRLIVRWVSGGCTLVAVGDKQVAVATGEGPEFEQTASYRYPDGTVVSISQSKHAWLGPLPGLDVQPLTTQALAALAADPKFHLD